MVTDWQMEPVGLDGVVWSADHAADVVGVAVGRVEVGVVADEDGHAHLHAPSVKHARRLQLFGELGASLSKQALNRRSHLELGNLAECHELVQGLLAHDVMVDILHEWALAEEPLMLNNAQIDDLVADPSAAVHFVEGWVQEGAEWDVLKREFALWRVLNPATQSSCRLCFNHNPIILSLTKLKRCKSKVFPETAEIKQPLTTLLQRDKIFSVSK